MVDWMIQVYRVLGFSSDQTFCLGISILDRFFEARREKEQYLDKDDLHQFGLTSVFLASKLEDVMPISMN